MRGRLQRIATHAGSWYPENKQQLNSDLDGYLKSGKPDSRVKAIITAHAGYEFCGSIMGAAYSRIDGSKFKRVFLLGPSHFAYLQSVALS